MCGIAGVFGESNPDLVSRMLAHLTHRGPDDSGIHTAATATLGNRRLAIIDLEGGHQPISNERATVTVVFNGEIYNYSALTRRLLKEGHRFATRSDTEVLVHLWEEEGSAMPGSLRGDFAFAIWDEGSQTGFLARDHLGVKPLYYSEAGGQLLFASEIKALLEDPRVSKELSLKALDEYLTYLYVPGDRTFFKAVKQLPPGCTLTHHGGRTVLRRYWSPPFLQGESQSPDLTELEEVLEEAISIRLMSDVPLGVFLSGGLDSSAVVAFASRASDRLKTFSIGYEDTFAAFNELKFSRQVARHFGTDHEELIVRPDIEETVHGLVAHLDQPFGDSSAVPTYLVSQAASRHLKVALSGIGGDELFGGYPRYLGLRWLPYYSLVPKLFRTTLARASGWIPEMESSRNLTGWIRSFLGQFDSEGMSAYHEWISFFGPTLRRRLLSDGVLERLQVGEQRLLDFLPEAASSRDLVGLASSLDLITYLPNDLLFMGDRMSMAHSLELRVPFCDHKLVERITAIPGSLRVGPRTLKKLLKKILAKHLPAQIVHRKKQGFMLPIGHWMKTELKPVLEHYLDAQRVDSQGLFNASTVQELLQQHFSGERRLTNQIWALLVFQIWYERQS